MPKLLISLKSKFLLNLNFCFFLDGVCDVLSNAEIVKSKCQCENPKEAAERLVDQALLYSCEDNATVTDFALQFPNSIVACGGKGSMLGSYLCDIIFSRFSRLSTARGSCTGLVTVGPDSFSKRMKLPCSTH